MDFKPGEQKIYYPQRSKPGHQVTIVAVRRHSFYGPKVVFRYANGREEEVAVRRFSTSPAKEPLKRRSIALTPEADEIVHDLMEEAEEISGLKVWWRYYAEIELLDFQGFVPWQLVNQILGYAPGYTMRGFGGGSGLKEITAEQFNALQTAFRQSQPNP